MKANFKERYIKQVVKEDGSFDNKLNPENVSRADIEVKNDRGDIIGSASVDKNNINLNVNTEIANPQLVAETLIQMLEGLPV